MCNGQYMLLHITVIPRSKQAGVVEHSHDHLKIKVSAAPDKGKANEEMCRILADYFEVRRSNIRIVRGHTVRKKIVEIIDRSEL